MARSAVTLNKLLEFNTGSVATGDAIDLVNLHELDVANVADESLMIRIENTSAITGTATFVAGGYFSGSTGGDLVIAIGANEVIDVAIETARFKDSAGMVNIDVASGGSLTGFVYATEIP